MKTEVIKDDVLLSSFLHKQDETAFKTLVSRYQRQLYNFVWRHIGQHEDVADICQQVFIQVFRKAEQYRGEASFKTWLYQIAINQCKNYYRSQARHPVDPVDPAELNAQTESTAYELVNGDEERQIFNRAITHLPDKQRQTLYLHLYQDCSFQEVANILGCPTGTAKANYHHAIQTLRKRLNPEQVNEP